MTNIHNMLRGIGPIPVVRSPQAPTTPLGEHEAWCRVGPDLWALLDEDYLPPRHKPASFHRQQDVTAWLRLMDTYVKLGELFDLLQHEIVSEARFLRLLRDVWSYCDNVAAYQPALESIFQAHTHPIGLMMNLSDRRKFHALPDVITVYRGCSASFPEGLSWSLSEATAESFLENPRYEVPDPVVLTAKVQKTDIIALISEREEDEIVTLRPEVIHVQRFRLE